MPRTGLGKIAAPAEFEEEEAELAGFGSGATFVPAETELADRFSRISVSREECGGAATGQPGIQMVRSRFGRKIPIFHRFIEEGSDRAQPARERGEKREARKQEAAAPLTERSAHTTDLSDAADAELARFQHHSKRRAKGAREEAGRGRESNLENQTPSGTLFQMFRQPEDAAGPADPDKMGPAPMDDQEEEAAALPVAFGFGGISFE